MTDSSVKARGYNERPMQSDHRGDVDPLMELSRIIGFDEPHAQASINHELSAQDTLALDLERELMGSLDDAFDRSGDSSGDDAADDVGTVFDASVFQPAIEPEAETYAEATSFQQPMRVEPPSLEDELENLLFGDMDAASAAPHQVAAPYQEPEPIYYDEPEPTVTQNFDHNFAADPAQDEELFALDEMVFDESEFAVEATEELELPQSPIMAEPDYSDIASNAPDLDSNYQPELAAAPSEEVFFSAEDFDFSFGDELEASAPATEPQPEPELKFAPFPHYAGQHSTLSVLAPDVETLSVAEGKVDQTFAMDLPEIEYHDESNNAGLSHLEAEFAEVFSSIGVDDTASQQEATAADSAFDDIFRDNYAGYGAAAGVAGIAATGAAASRTPDYSASDIGIDDYNNHWAAQGVQPHDDSGYPAASSDQDDAYQNFAGDDLGAAAAAYRNRPVRGRRGLLLATVAGALVLIGGVGYHFIGGGSGTGEPVVIRADTQPIKVQPENPGGANVPNQDKAVYDRVAGTIPQNPEQKSLVTSDEQPVDLNINDNQADVFDEDGADRLQSATVSAPNNQVHEPAPLPAPLIVPRQVQTMIVKADGTIVQQPAAAVMPTAPVEQEATALTPPATPVETPAVKSPIEQMASVDGVAPKVPARVVQTETHTPPVPMKAPVVPSRPAEQPLTIVGSVQPKAQAPSAAAAVPAGSYLIQIASQPTAEAAQQSYATMAQKYANVIGGRGVDIRKAEVAGKGTYYRVRVAAGSKSDATSLCERLKTAGGSCFVTQ